MTRAGEDDDGPAGPAGPPMVPYAEWAAQQPAPRECLAPAADADRSGRTTALACAAAWSLPPALALWVSGAWAAGTAHDHFVQSWAGSAAAPTPPPYGLWLLLIGGACWTMCTAAELLHAYRAGGDYPPRGPWARLAASPVLRVLRWLPARLDRKLGGGCLGVVALVLLGPLIVITWGAVTGAAAPLWVIAVGLATIAHLTTVI